LWRPPIQFVGAVLHLEFVLTVSNIASVLSRFFSLLTLQGSVHRRHVNWIVNRKVLKHAVKHPMLNQRAKSDGKL